jgi:uncharacterized protein YtpQ (UPF0354 family)
LTPASFTLRFADALRRLEPACTITVPGELSVIATKPDGTEHTAHLDNAWTMASANPKDVGDVLARYVASFRESLGADTAALDRDRIVPVIKDRAWLDEVHAALRERGSAEVIAGVWEPYNDELIVVYAQDSATNIRYLERGALEAVGLDRNELRALAVKNLLRLLPEIQARGRDGVFLIAAGGDYEASLLLADEMWEGGRVKVNGDVVVAVPSRDLLLVCGSGDPHGIARVREMAAKVAAEAPYRLTSELFVRRNGRFERFVTEP